MAGWDGYIMDRMHYEEMAENLDKLIREGALRNKKIYLFGHCNATEELAGLLADKGFAVAAILDNNSAKQGKYCRGIMIQPPGAVMAKPPGQTVVCIVARAYAAMADQLKRMGYTGQIRKLADYDSYAEYSLSEDTIARKEERAGRGMGLLEGLRRRYPGGIIILCPFSALGDIYYMASYLPWYLRQKGGRNCVIVTVGRACAQVAGLFGAGEVEAFSQTEMDETVQAALYSHAPDVFIPHQDRPYVVNLHRALYMKCIPLEKIYCCGVFGLPADTVPYKPSCLRPYGDLERIPRGRSVIISPYAKSVTALPDSVWRQIVRSYSEEGYQCFTNVAGEEEPLPDTLPISPGIPEMQSAVERAGTFIGIRSGICDVLRESACRKVALYPDYNYCDTKWKAIDMYRLEGWENIVVKDGFRWEKN